MTIQIRSKSVGKSGLSQKKHERLVTIVVCTHNRCQDLIECVSSLISQIVRMAQVELLIVDNASVDGTADAAMQFVRNSSNIRYVCEPNVGLSSVRNRGYLEADAPWVAYLDDDVIVTSDYVRQLLVTIKGQRFDAFGGVYLALYPDGGNRPDWIPENFGTNSNLRSEGGELDENQFFSGGVCAFRCDALISVGGFPLALGMQGGRIAYGEETYIQIRMREKKFVMGFDPRLVVYHKVTHSKLKARWHFISFWRQGVCHREVFGVWERPGRIFSDLCEVLRVDLPRMVRTLNFKTLSRIGWKGYAVQSVAPTMYTLGRMFTTFSVLAGRYVRKLLLRKSKKCMYE